MMDGNGNGGHGLIEGHVDLEVDNISFWATLGVSAVDPDNSIQPHHHHHHHNNHHQQQQQHHVSMESHLELVEQPLRRELFTVESDPRIEPYVGMEFDSGEAAKTFYIAYAGRIGFSVRVARSRRSKCNESVIMLRFVCSREGFSREKRIVAGKKTRKRAASIREGCKAMLEVIRRGDEKWVITKLVKDHNHEVGMPSRVHYIATEIEGEMEPYIGMEFESLEVAKTFYYAYASRVGFEARVRQSRRSLQDESLKMLKLVCSKHRYHSGRDNNSEDVRRLLQDPGKEGCDALFEIIRKDGEVWMVSKLILDHNHELKPPSPSKVRCVRSQGEILVIAKNFSDTRSLLLNGQESRYLREVRYNDLGSEDAQNFLDYLKKTQAENSTFFFAVQIVNNNCMTNIFWADANARLAYKYFGDAVVFDMSHKSDKEKEMIPIVTFRGVNHHAQPIVFGYALLVDDSESSFVWIFEQWLAAMSSREPVSLVTGLNRAVAIAASKVFPNTRHCFCKRHILSTIQAELLDFCSAYNIFEELVKCINESETCDSFESCWDAIIGKYDLRDNRYLQSLYNIRHQWIPVYLKDTFFAEVNVSLRSEDLDSIIERSCSSKISLKLAFRKLTQGLAINYEKEAQADYLTLFGKPYLRTASPMEKQAAGIYTRIIFDRFQEEFVESFGYHVVKIEDGMVSKYQVALNEEDEDTYTVTFDVTESKAHCSCCMFEIAGILCRHALKVFIVSGIRTLPKDYILRRWTRHAKSSDVGDECGVELGGNCGEPSSARYNDLCRDAIKCAKEGSASSELYSVAKDSLQKALVEIVAAKHKKEQQSLQSFIKSQKKQNKKLGKVAPKQRCSKQER